MSVQTAHEMLQSEIESLPEALVREVLDFVLFMKSRYKEDRFLWDRVLETRAYREEHPDEVATVSAEEWDALTPEAEEG